MRSYVATSERSNDAGPTGSVDLPEQDYAPRGVRINIHLSPGGAYVALDLEAARALVELLGELIPQAEELEPQEVTATRST